MPKIDVADGLLERFLGRPIDDAELEPLLSSAKAVLDERDLEAGIRRIELNDTNRPDLWSTAGLARQLRARLGEPLPAYDCFSQLGAPLPSEERVIEVDAGLESVRPYIVGFQASGPAVGEALLVDLIQTQEKLCWSYGRKRRAIAMGVYRAGRMRYPIRYVAADPDATSFAPLPADQRPPEEMTLRQVLERHPKGMEFGPIIAGHDRFPFLVDASGGALSMPPVINSADLGAVEPSDDDLFIEVTGTDLSHLLLATAIVACDLVDAGFRIRPVTTRYPYDTPFGREVTAPLAFQEPVRVELSHVGRLLGEAVASGDALRFLRLAGVEAQVSGDSLTVRPPPFRNDFLHPVDVIEEVMIGRGLSSFRPTLPEEFTAGRLTDLELFSRRARALMVGLGYEELMVSYLGSYRDHVERMRAAGNAELDGQVLRIANPISESYAVVRASSLPSLLRCEAASAHAVYPHRLFEVGKVARRDGGDDSGTVTRTHLGFLLADGPPASTTSVSTWPDCCTTCGSPTGCAPAPTRGSRRAAPRRCWSAPTRPPPESSASCTRRHLRRGRFRFPARPASWSWRRWRRPQRHKPASWRAIGKRRPGPNARGDSLITVAACRRLCSERATICRTRPTSCGSKPAATISAAPSLRST